MSLVGKFFNFIACICCCIVKLHFQTIFVQDDPLKASMHSFLMSGQNMQEIGLLDNKVSYTLAVHDHPLVLISLIFCNFARQIHETVEQINAIKLQREFYLGFSDNPQKFINDWLASQNRDLKVRIVSHGSVRVVTVIMHLFAGDERSDG